MNDDLFLLVNDLQNFYYLFTRLIFTSRNQEVMRLALRALCSMTAKQSRYTATIADALERRPFLVQLTYLCRRPSRRVSIAVSEQATTLVGNILRYSCNCSAANFLTERVGVVQLNDEEEDHLQTGQSARESGSGGYHWREEDISSTCFHRCCCCPLLCLIACVLLLLSLSGALLDSLQ